MTVRVCENNIQESKQGIAHPGRCKRQIQDTGPYADALLNIVQHLQTCHHASLLTPERHPCLLLVVIMELYGCNMFVWFGEESNSR